MDNGIYLAVNGLAGRNGLLDHLLVWSATALPAAMLILIAAAWFWPGSPVARGQRQRLAVYAVVAAVIALAIGEAIGHVWFRQRPFVFLPAHLLLAHAADASFPSSHAVASFALATPFLLARRRLGSLLFACAMLVAVARVATGLHYPSDVVGGALLGMAVGAAVWFGRDWIERPIAWALALAQRFRVA
ncbi:MAG TPA: phosphatase PAP2 family protein [Thermomicrobiales bacterium]|jgi:undecaprenyl-diphosphatase|nr:phosphatase PAP2 family protein [Thermomicrobiales bacterium]